MSNDQTERDAFIEWYAVEHGGGHDLAVKAWDMNFAVADAWRASKRKECEYARKLAIALAEKHYPEITSWKPLTDLLGILTQIDNMTALLIKPHQNALDGGAVSQEGREALECFNAAFSEGWNEALANGDIEQLQDLWNRRIYFAYEALLTSQPCPTIRELWTALRMIRELVEQHTLPGSVPNGEYLPPEPSEEAEAIISGINAMRDSFLVTKNQHDAEMQALIIWLLRKDVWKCNLSIEESAKLLEAFRNRPEDDFVQESKP